MSRIAAIGLTVAALCAACATPHHASNQPYQPASAPEKIEFCQDRLDVYPDDARGGLARYASNAVVWTGIIASNDFSENENGRTIRAVTVFEHHYFDWVQDGNGGGARLAVSPKGEGNFSTEWEMKKTTIDSGIENAEKYACRGKLAVVYGVPERVAADGTVVLKYRYLRILDHNQFTTNQYDYGRFGEGFTVLRNTCAPVTKP